MVVVVSVSPSSLLLLLPSSVSLSVSVVVPVESSELELLEVLLSSVVDESLLLDELSSEEASELLEPEEPPSEEDELLELEEAAEPPDVMDVSPRVPGSVLEVVCVLPMPSVYTVVMPKALPNTRAVTCVLASNHTNVVVGLFQSIFPSSRIAYVVEFSTSLPCGGAIRGRAGVPPCVTTIVLFIDVIFP